MEKRRFGRTGHISSVVIFGAFAVGQLGQDEADETLQRLLDHGVNHIDIAPSYHDAEKRVGPWLEAYRDRFFLGCKTQIRSREGAWREANESLERLRTDKFDLYQLHAVATMDELDACFARGGSFEAILRVREEGLADYLGITSHGLQAPAVQLEALRRFDFDSLLLPLNFKLMARDDYRRDMQALLRTASQRDVGVMVIKAWAQQPWAEGEQRAYHTWYKPFDDPDSVEQMLSFALSHPITGAISAGDAALLPMILAAAERYQPLDEQAQADLMATAGQYEIIFT
ncbi:MAG: aldo/keto reductase [Anaerolineae bacterium]|nr:aldo/keto reductase [Anaerolineae bacterium]